MIVQTNNGYLVYAQREGQSDADYDAFVEFTKTKPQEEKGHTYKLLWPDKVWKLVKIDDSDEEIEDSEALEILLGGAS